ncbi:NAD(P)H-binding protein [Planomonospora sp. ID67723]|uniref:NAD(P)H-binding protein n=1 Tax=Planomonospora sp. ID67723 TaxID=2738134 RepID=UPI0018C41708|nr:NAD(P)H-binding protein [Planomonospora sp. ID67723]MBG0827533.1 NAD(P)H-binding protein [Planomonospora sp. ID67723]
MILVTGASGALGRLVVDRLAGRTAGRTVAGTAVRPVPGDVVAGTRNPERLPAGVPVRRIDFDDPASLPDGFAGVDTLLLVSAGYGEDDAVIARHGAAIDAAEKAGVGHIVYTSLSAAGDHLAYALAHRWTERRLRSGTAGWTILRNGLYAELLAALTPVVDGRITAPLGSGRLAAVAREDLADAAVRVVTDAAAHAGQVYELVGEEAVGGADLARARSAATGAAVSYEPGTLAQAREDFASLGLAPFQVPMLVSTYSAIAGGFMAETGGDLRALLDRAPRSALETAVTAAHGGPPE